jgi:hypothetical protein
MYNDNKKLKINIFSLKFDREINSLELVDTGSHLLTMQDLEDSVLDSIKYHFENLKAEMRENNYTHELGIAIMPFFNFPYNELLTNEEKKAFKKIDSKIPAKKTKSTKKDSTNVDLNTKKDGKSKRGIKTKSKRS